jgi:hypothetical protein
MLAEAGQFAGVVQMGMAQDHRVNSSRMERESPVKLFRFLPVSLEQTALQQQSFGIDLNQIHRAGGGAGRPEEMDFHAEKMPFKIGLSSIP